MADENDDVLDNGTQDHGDAGGQQQQQDHGTQTPSREESSLDKTIDDFIARSTHTPASGKQSTPTGGANQGQGGQQQQRQQQGNGAGTGQGNQSNANGQPPQPTFTPTRTYGSLFRQDRNGNIFTSEGELIAKAGAGHNLFRRLYPYIESAVSEAGAMKSRLDAYENADNLAKAAGLSLDERSAAINLMVAFKRDPAKAVNFLLDQAQQRGVDISAVRGGQSFDMSAFETTLQNKIADALKPFQFLLDDRAEQEQNREHSEAAAREYHAFHEEFPDARLHEDAIASVMNAKMQQGEMLSAREAYYMLRADAATRGLDWSKPLAPQYRALVQQNGGGNGQRQQPTIPNMGGRGGAPVGGGGPAPAGKQREADANASWSSIIASVFDEHGIQH